MNSVKAGDPLCDVIELCYGADRPALLIGQHGIGKSELLEQAASRMGISYICRDLSLMEAPDLIGLPKLKGQSTIYAPPDFLPTSGKGLLVFEELNRCERHVRAPCLQLLTARTLNDYQLPAGWLPVAAINPADADYEVSELDPALLSRFVQVEVIPDRDEWLKWARRSGVHASVIRYVESDSSVFNSPDSSPRAWTYVSKVLQAAERGSASGQAVRTAVLGTVGDKRGTAFLKTFKQPVRPLTADEILTAYSRHRDHVRAWIDAGRIDLVDQSLRAVLTFLQPEADYVAVKNQKPQWNNLSQFLSDLPGDQRQSASTFFTERQYMFPNAKMKARTR